MWKQKHKEKRNGRTLPRKACEPAERWSVFALLLVAVLRWIAKVQLACHKCWPFVTIMGFGIIIGNQKGSNGNSRWAKPERQCNTEEAHFWSKMECMCQSLACGILILGIRVKFFLQGLTHFLHCLKTELISCDFERFPEPTKLLVSHIDLWQIRLREEVLLCTMAKRNVCLLDVKETKCVLSKKLIIVSGTNTLKKEENFFEPAITPLCNHRATQKSTLPVFCDNHFG